MLRGNLLSGIRQDLLYTIRTLRRDRTFTIMAVLILAIGIGANTAIFSVMSALILRPLPFRDASRLVWVSNSTGAADNDLSGNTSRALTFVEWRRLNHSMDDMAAYNAFFGYFGYALTGTGEPERVNGVDVSESFFRLLGVSPQIGREFVPEEFQRNGRKAVILANGFWKRRFASDGSIVGRTVTINGESISVVGVLPASFDFSSIFTPGARVDFFLPLPLDKVTDNYGNFLSGVGHLRPGVPLEKAQAEMSVIDEQLHKQYPERGDWYHAKLTPLQDHVRGSVRRSILVLAGAVGFVLLIACANLSNLLLARAVSRRKEMALRTALGAARLRLIRQMLTESTLLSLCGAVLGIPVAWWGTRVLAGMQAGRVPMLAYVGLDAATLAFTLGIAVLTGIVFGLAPALQISGADLNDTLKEGRTSSAGRQKNWNRAVLVTSEVALASMLLVGAGLLMRSFLRLLDVDLGFRPDHVAALRIDPGPAYNEQKATAALQEIVRRVKALPGIESAGLSDALPLDRDRTWDLRRVGQAYPANQSPTGFVRVIDADYFRTMNIPVLAGRVFDERDNRTAEPVMIINQSAAKRLWPDRSPVGDIASTGNSKYRVVGVVADVRHTAVDEQSGFEFYLSYLQGAQAGMDLVVRTSLPPDGMASAVRSAVWSVDPNIPANEFRSIGQLVDRALSPRKFTVRLLGLFAGIALLLASLGIYSMISYSVAQRTQEIGIRMALGATASSVQTKVIGQAMTLVVAGVAIGAVGSLALTRWMSSLLFGVSSTDPMTFAMIPFVLLAVAFLAAYLPARRAARIDPMIALRYE